MKLFKLFIIALFLVTSSSYLTAAKSTPTKKCVAKHRNKKVSKKADRNNDGRIDQKEYHAYKKKQSEVNKPWEVKADKNNDGYVDRKELKQHKKRSRTPKINGVSLAE